MAEWFKTTQDLESGDLLYPVHIGICVQFQIQLRDRVM